MFRIIKIDGIISSYICKNNKADKYGDPKIFKTRKDAEIWIKRNSYKYMTFKYEIEEI